MFSVEIREIEKAIQMLEQLIKKGDIERECLKKLTSEVRQTSEFDDVNWTLQKILSKLEAEEYVLKKMKTSLEKNYQLYQLCENRILQYKDECIERLQNKRRKENHGRYNRD